MIARAWYVRCDNCGNPGEVATDSAKQAKEYALAQGFIVRNRQWICPWGCAQDVASVVATPRKEHDA